MTAQTEQLLREEIRKLREAIETHRNQRADDRCWLDDLELYAALGDEVVPDNRVGDKYEMLGNCARFIDRRCEDGGWPNYIDIEREIQAAHDLLTELGAPPQHFDREPKPGGILIPTSRSLVDRIKLLKEGAESK